MKWGSPLGKITTQKLTEFFGMMTSSSPDERHSAVSGIKAAPPAEMADVLSDPDLSVEILDFFARHSSGRIEWVQALKKNPSLPVYLHEFLGEDGAFMDNSAAAAPVEGADAARNRAPEDKAEPEDHKRLSMEQRIQKMNVGEKIKLAFKGDKEARNLLVKDTNREVYMSVLENPGIKESELELLTKNTGTNSEILRTIGRNREWTSNRNIVKSLMFNPKTPLDVSIRFLPRMNLRDLELIDASRSLPSALRANAKRLIAQKRKSR